jgi:hypothetical protein
MTRDHNPNGKSSSKHQGFIGEQPRKLVDKSNKSFARHKKFHGYSDMHDSDELSRGRHIYDRAAIKSVTREMLRASQI